MNKDWILFHLREALEEFEKTIANVKENPDYDEIEFGIAITHLYNHINTAWNARNVKYEDMDNSTDKQFYEWRSFPKDIDLNKP